MAANTAELLPGVSVHPAWVRRFRYAGFVTQILTVNSDREIGMLTIPLLFL